MDSRKYRSSSDKHLIAEQPGMTILILGFVIAFLIGYVTRSIISPARVSARIEKAASHIHKDIKVRFGSAHFSLSDGILPRMAIVVSQVHMESTDSCWGSPILEVDELRLPVSLWSALAGKGAVRDIQANIVNVRLREDFKNCDEDSEEGKAAKVSAPLVSLTPSQQSTKYQNDIRGVFIRKLQMQSDKYPQYKPEFLNFAVKVKSFEPRVIEVTAKSHLLRDVSVGDYLSHANLYIQYKESPEQSVQVHFFGNWREGHYSVIANYSIDENLLALETDLKHIPLSQILAILQKYNMASKELNGRQVWISSKARTVTAVDKLRSAPLEIRDLRLEGDLGEMRVDLIDVQSLEPLVYKPIIVDIHKLDIEKLLVLLNRPKKTNMLGALGLFSGRAEIASDKKMKMTGEHTGLEFVFSNKGQQELQVIDTMVGDIALNNDTWNFNIQRVEPRGGVFIGNLKMKADRDFSDVDIKTRIEELAFATPVQKLMTNGGDVGVLSLDADLSLKDGELKYLKGLVRVDSMNVEGMSFAKTKASLDWSQGDVLLRTQMKSLQVKSDSSASPVLKQVTAPSWWTNDGLSMTSLTADLRSKSLRQLSWKGFQAQIGKSGKLTTDGSWDSSGNLKGVVLNREAKSQHRWAISGTRETPIFTSDERESSGAKK